MGAHRKYEDAEEKWSQVQGHQKDFKEE